MFHWHWGNHMIAPVPLKQPWWIWANDWYESTKKWWYNHNKTKQKKHGIYHTSLQPTNIYLHTFNHNSNLLSIINWSGQRVIDSPLVSSCQTTKLHWTLSSEHSNTEEIVVFTKLPETQSRAPLSSHKFSQSSPLPRLQLSCQLPNMQTGGVAFNQPFYAELCFEKAYNISAFSIIS